MTRGEHKGEPIIQLPDPPSWRAWLELNHARPGGVWLKHAKKASGLVTVTHAEALRIAIAFGWIDGQRAPLDASYYLQRFIARSPRSRWSQVNRATASELIESGEMHPAGLDQVAAAQADGRWEAAYEPQSRATVPADLQAALDADPDASAFFGTLTGVKRYAFLYRLTTIKRPETRARRIAQYVEMMHEGRTLHD